ncbi:unnamed protein product [Amoebophrya sp. A120]|nr:unnamed protein product [Amoebophrya sp. A120]|eukprot:GSA120T00012316001.1
MARATVQALRGIWRDRDISRKLKATLYQSLANSVALYNAETWHPREHDLKALRWFQRSTLKTVEGEKRAWQYAQEEAEGAEEYASRLDLCNKTGVPPIETILRERRVAWAAHTFRNPNEACHHLTKQEIRKSTPRGRMVKEDFEAIGLPVDGFMDLKPQPAAHVVKAHLVAKRPTKPLPKQQKTDRRGKTKACKARTARQSENIRKQKEEAEQKQAEFIASISGRRWERVPNTTGSAWQTEKSDADPDPVMFQIDAEDFCENSGRTEYRVCGIWFQKMSDGTYAAR